MKWNGKDVFKKLEKKLLKVKNEAPKILANEGQKVFLENFATESWNNLPWPKRKKDTGKPILRGKTRRLINSVRKSVRMANVDRIKWGTDVPYAAIHNFGLQVSKGWHYRNSTIKRKVRGNAGFVKGTWRQGRAKTVTFKGAAHYVNASYYKMPKRQFMGVSLKLKKRLRLKFESVFKANLK